MSPRKSTPWRAETFARVYRGINIWVEWDGPYRWEWSLSTDIRKLAADAGITKSRRSAQLAAERAVDAFFERSSRKERPGRTPWRPVVFGRTYRGTYIFVEDAYSDPRQRWGWENFDGGPCGAERTKGAAMRRAVESVDEACRT